MGKIEKDFYLTPFEEYMFLDDSATFPMFSFLSFLFSGVMDASVWEEALKIAVQRHPLTNAQVLEHRGHYYWQFRETEPVLHRYTVTGTPENPPPYLNITPSNIRETCGLVVTFEEFRDTAGNVTGGRLGLLIHHTVSDGLGMMAFVDDLFLAYDALIDHRRVESVLPAFSPMSLALRQNPGLTWSRYFKVLVSGMPMTAAMVLGRPESFVPLPKKLNRNRPITRFPLVEEFGLSEEQTRGCLTEAKRLGVTLNDLFLRHLFLAVKKFKERHGHGGEGCFRIAMPINMRPKDFPPLFATNVVSMLFLDRKPQMITPSKEFLAGIHHETERLKRTDQGLVLLENLKGRRFWPGGLKWELELERCWSTTVLSNLGQIFTKIPLPRTEDGRICLGDAVLESYSGTPPLRARTVVSWGCWTYAGRLRFAVRWDDRFLTPEQNAEGIAIFRDLILDGIEGKS